MVGNLGRKLILHCIDGVEKAHDSLGVGEDHLGCSVNGLVCISHDILRLILDLAKLRNRLLD